MQIKEFSKLLETSGLPVAYWSFPEKEAPELPYIIYLINNNNDYYADDLNYVDIGEVDVELYSSYKDFKTEGIIEQIFKTNHIKYNKSSFYIKKENMWETLYELEIIIDQGE